MAGTDKRKPAEKKFDTNTPLDRQHLRAWVEHFAAQLEDSDSVEIALTSEEGSGRRTVSFQASANPNYNPCPGRRLEPAEPRPKPGPTPEPEPEPEDPGRGDG
jgi:hypothetical protein